MSKRSPKIIIPPTEKQPPKLSQIIRVIINEAMPEDEVWLDNGKEVVKIKNIKI